MEITAARCVALISAFATMLLGMPLLAASAVHEAWPQPSVTVAPADFDTVSASGVELEEREEESQSKTHSFPGCAGGGPPACRCQGMTGQGRIPPTRGSQARVVVIRGPPAA